MRILFCNYEYPPLGGGGGVINAQLAEELARRHEVTVLTSRGLDLAREEVVNNVRIIRVPVFFRNLSAAANMPSMLAYLPMGITRGKRLLADEAFDVINTHFALPSGPVGAALARRARIPNVLSVHGGDLYDPSKWSSPHRHALLRTWVRRLLRHADRVVAQSGNTRDNVHRYYDARLGVDLIPLGIKAPPPGVARREQYGLGPEHRLLVTVGRLVARKAVDRLIALLDRLPGHVHLLIIGTGPQEDTLRRRAAETGLTARVHFLGQLAEEEKFSVLRMSDIYVSTSQHEGFGLVFIEAMACGLPVVCYNHGGQTDFLEDGITGRLLDLNDETGFLEACRALDEDDDLRARTGRANLDRAREYFIDRCAARYEQLFEEAILVRRAALAGTGERPGAP